MAEPLTEPVLELIEMLKALPEDLQREAAERIRPIVEEFDERYWDRQFADPRSEAFFAQMAEECERAGHAEYDQIVRATTIERNQSAEASFAHNARHHTGASMDIPQIVSNPNVMMGKPVVAGTRITVEHILRELAAGTTIDQLLAYAPAYLARRYPGRSRLCS